MLGKKANLAITAVVLIVFSGMTYTTIFDSSTQLNVSAGYLNATATSDKTLIIISSPGIIQFNVTVKTDASSVFIFSIGNVTVGTSQITTDGVTHIVNDTTNITTFVHTKTIYNGINCNSTNNYNYVEISNFKNDTEIKLFLNVTSLAFEHMQTFSPNNIKTVYRVGILVMGSNNGEQFLGFGIGKI